jgi:predicted 3-demethylubiquinone-9 3-methyltransferase (glyoxalase superfamily)
MADQKLTTCLWLDDEAEEMVEFYKSVFKKNFKEGDKTLYPTDTPSNKPVGSVLTYEFEIFGNRFMALNGGPEFKFNEAVSFVIDCNDQEEIDYYWEALSAVPESEVCGWLKDKFNVSWQITPTRLDEMIKSDDKEAAKRATDAMLKMKKLVIEDLEKAYRGE